MMRSRGCVLPVPRRPWRAKGARRRISFAGQDSDRPIW
jgi:hypothetical protein